eukprot:CAMPEP_0116871228 /NCGR_PEP_ID=MMETSP0463-20121206/1481_1 /TAXON_ID=181622 /ORGANISM="Strombidinopsis sp, Strain SopsisLIS2011" /LENGTH=53 /DNA_ID=CAMNT_0004509245 /DNA_START=99 /DNA_END=260 /DNA_ORIENTATION=+
MMFMINKYGQTPLDIAIQDIVNNKQVAKKNNEDQLVVPVDSMKINESDINPNL